jgi:hypothetical protein
MKTEEFKKLVRAVVQEELKKQLPNLVPQILSEALTGKQSQVIARPPVVKTTLQAKKPVKKEYKQFVKDPILNQIFNETVVKIKPENSPFIGYSDPVQSEVNGNEFQVNEEIVESENDSIDYSVLSESVSPKTPVVSNVQPETEEQAKVLGKINRDFRSLMKAVDAKKKDGLSFGNGGVGIE